jgi:hypothetical protein
MKRNQQRRCKRNEVILSIFISIFLLSSMTLKAQTSTNFSGRWELDQANSDREKGEPLFDGSIILEIKLTSDTISFNYTYFMTGREGFKMPADSYLANGNVTADHSGSDPAKKYVKWSQDKKILTTNYIMTASIDGVAQDFITITTYKLSEDGKTLIIEELHKSKLNGERTIKKTYRKK